MYWTVHLTPTHMSSRAAPDYQRSFICVIDCVTGALGNIDCVHVLNLDTHGTSSVIAAGSRDSDVYVWRKRPSEPTSVPGRRRSMREYTMATLKGHGGWVWSLTSEKEHRPQLLCSGSWDCTVKAWDVSTSVCITTLQ